MVKKRVPTDEIIIPIIKEILKRRYVILTLTELYFLVRERLKRINSRFVTSPQRLKRLVLRIPEIEIRAKTKRSAKRVSLDSCPVCNKSITKLFGKNLLGRRIHVGYKCKNCGYNATAKAVMPREYLFILKKR